jgi:type II secretory pathway pseudopilin PulG
MRAVFTVLGLVVVLAIVGVTAKKQLSAGVAPPVAGMPATAATPQQQVQQFQKAAENALQQARPMPEDSK